jgi:hypothetical protein
VVLVLWVSADERLLDGWGGGVVGVVAEVEAVVEVVEVLLQSESSKEACDLASDVGPGVLE